MDRTGDDAALLALLQTPRRIAVVGASPNEARASHRIFAYLKGKGHHVIPINPVADEVLGVPCAPTVAEAVQRWGAAPEIVDVFRAPEHLPGVVDDALASGAQWLWCQLGVVHPEAIDRAIAGGLDVVVDRCILVESERLAA